MGQKYKIPLGDIYEPACSVNRKKSTHGRCSGLCGELRVAVSSKESWDPSELEGEKSLLSGLLVGILVLAEVLSGKEE